MAGRPPKWESPEQLQKLIDEYFESCFEEIEYADKDGSKRVVKRQVRPFTITGLALALDTTRQGLLNYEQKDEFYDTIKKAKLRCENYAEEQLFQSKNTAGVIFNMVNNYGWKNKQEHDQNVNVKGKLEDFFK